jgi:hypothetical protein
MAKKRGPNTGVQGKHYDTGFRMDTEHRRTVVYDDLLHIVKYLKAHLDEGSQQVYFHSLATDDDDTTLADLVLRAIKKAGV